jgi:hypothetical protein
MGNGGPGGGPAGIPGGRLGGINGSSNSFDLTLNQNSEVKTAFDTLKTELRNDIPVGAKPTYASIGTLMDDLDAIRGGSLTGTDATSKVQADEAAALSALGVSDDQITAIQTDEAALVSAIEAVNSTTSSGDSNSTPTSTPLGDLADVPLLPFLTQLRQNQRMDGSGSGSASGNTTSSSTDTSTT